MLACEKRCRLILWAFFLLVAGNPPPVYAEENLDKNFTVNAFNDAWVRQHGPDVMMQSDFSKTAPLAPHQQYNERIFNIIRYGTAKDYDAFEQITKPSLWSKIQGNNTPQVMGKNIAENPLLFHAAIGFTELCAEAANTPLDTAAKFSLEYLSKRAFLTNRHPDLTAEDLELIRRFNGLSYAYGGKLAETCEAINVAYSISQPKVAAKLKEAIVSTNHVIHQCGSELENTERIKNALAVGSVASAIPYYPSYYDSLPVLGLKPPPSAATLECQPYYKALIDAAQSREQAKKQAEAKEKEEIKNSIVKTQFIRDATP